MDIPRQLFVINYKYRIFDVESSSEKGDTLQVPENDLQSDNQSVMPVPGQEPLTDSALGVATNSEQEQKQMIG